MLIPPPFSGFAISYLLLTGLGVSTAFVYLRLDHGEWLVAAILVPLLFARLSLIGARTQQEMSERIRKQQQSLLDATERVFHEREQERNRIAEEIHDTSLQMLAAASYGCGNASEFVKAGRFESAQESLLASRDAIDEAMKAPPLL
jgi:signal transduction histidine kinase